MPNNTLERTGEHRGPRLAAARYRGRPFSRIVEAGPGAVRNAVIVISGAWEREEHARPITKARYWMFPISTRMKY
jgi:hypothetical protein